MMGAVFLQSNTGATIHFITWFTAATIRGCPLIQGSVYYGTTFPKL